MLAFVIVVIVSYINFLFTLQSETEQRPYKVSFYVQKDKAQDIMKSLSKRLEERGVDVTFTLVAYKISIIAK